MSNSNIENKQLIIAFDIGQLEIVIYDFVTLQPLEIYTLIGLKANDCIYCGGYF